MVIWVVQTQFHYFKIWKNQYWEPFLNIKSIFTFLFLIIRLSAIYGNDSFSYIEPGSGLVVLSDIDGISMETETLNYDFESNHFTVTYSFYNSTDTNQEIKLAFPISSKGYSGFAREEYSTAEDWMNGTYRFRTEINGREYERELHKLDTQSASDNYDYAYILDITFPSKEEIIITDRYFSKGNNRIYYDYYYPESNDLQTMIFYDNTELKYILETANNWDGTIKDFQCSYSAGSAINFITIGNDLYLFNNHMLKAHEFSSNYDDMNIELEETNQSHESKIYYRMDFQNFIPQQNLTTNYNTRWTESINAMTFSGTIYEYLQGDSYNIDHIHYLLEMILEVFPKGNFDEILYRAIVNLDSNLSNPSIFANLPIDYKDYVGTEMVTLSRFYLNTLFAKAGYKFNNQKWEEIFRYYDWYTPRTKNVSFSDEINQKIEQIKEIRSKYNSISANELSHESFDMPKFKLEYQGK